MLCSQYESRDCPKHYQTAREVDLRTGTATHAGISLCPVGLDGEVNLSYVLSLLEIPLQMPCACSSTIAIYHNLRYLLCRQWLRIAENVQSSVLYVSGCQWRSRIHWTRCCDPVEAVSECKTASSMTKRRLHVHRPKCQCTLKGNTRPRTWVTWNSCCFLRMCNHILDLMLNNASFWTWG